ncbi:transcription termination factor NusA [Pelagicoccus mobilis]|uniref:Transcription termination/antitermination protein NusA n=1 Tax=Pelagicoccus mobilis TaxID=415221 RepID=A0A934RTS3_9BACT|nr:transcription termination factor NusA [Pelagicoccus mobilis]MBK1875250.1 transcription termination/antitermination protein NusA [Pelagicoccus mobilis]
MSSEILSVLEYMEKEKGIGREDMISAIITAIKNAAAKGVNAGQELKITIDPRNGKMNAWALLDVVDSVSDPKTEISLEKARQVDTELNIGDIYEKEIDPAYLGRIAAQTARQAIMQRLRQFEKERIYDDFKDQVGDIVSGIVRRRERGDLIIDLGKAEAMMPSRDQVPGEDYSPGERIRCFLLKIEATNRGPELILTRSNAKFVLRLFDLEVTEIADGTVKIEAFSREPGYRTKIAVTSTDPKVDPVGACVGARGARVKSIVRELGGEKIDIIRYFEDPKEMALEALKPAIPRNVIVDERNRRISIEVSEDDLAVAIGRKGQNARLTSKLVGWKIDIMKEEVREVSMETKQAEAAQGLNQIEGIDAATAERLVNNGLISPELFLDVEVDDLAEMGFSAEEAADILAKVNQFLQSQGISS